MQWKRWAGESLPTPLCWELVIPIRSRVKRHWITDAGPPRAKKKKKKKTSHAHAHAQLADVVVAMLEDEDDRVRERALATLGKQDPATLAQHVGTW